MYSANSNTNFLPWHAKAWQQFFAYQQQQRLPHALLISGMPGLGKKTFSEQMARILLCESKSSHADSQTCGECFSCKLPTINEHPDYFELIPLEESKVIKIEQVRDLIESLQQTSHRIGNRIIVIMPAETMNHATANALLKILEEPGSGCHFLLISHSPAQLSATIRSRCQTLRINPDFSDKTLHWVANQTKQPISIATELLQQAEGSPQRAVEFADADVKQKQIMLIDELNAVLKDSSTLINIAQNWQKRGLQKIIDETIFILNQLIAFNIQGEKSIPEALIILSHISAKKLIDYTQYIMQVKKDLVINPNLNAQLLSEAILLKWLN